MASRHLRMTLRSPSWQGCHTGTPQFGDPRTVEISVADPKQCCSFCHRSDVNPTEYGVLLKLDDIVTHHFCLLFSALVEQTGNDNEGIQGFLPTCIRKEVMRGKRLRCKFCKEYNATIGCGVSRCPISFHYTCGYDAGCLFQFFGQFQGYCPRHKPKQNIPPNICTECPICLVDTELDEAVWPPCCGKRLFHRGCLMYTAKAAGYFFKCPFCNSTEEKFINAMKSNGIYIPQQDAAWELDPNAFQEQLVLYSHCDVKVCVCPNGRKFSSRNGYDPWCMVRCGCCGASATHMKCSGLRIHKWNCHSCRAVLKNSVKKSSAEFEKIYNSDSDNVHESSTSDSSDESSPEDELVPKLPSINSVIKQCLAASGLTQIQTDDLTKSNETVIRQLCIFPHQSQSDASENKKEEYTLKNQPKEALPLEPTEPNHVLERLPLDSAEPNSNLAQETPPAERNLNQDQEMLSVEPNLNQHQGTPLLEPRSLHFGAPTPSDFRKRLEALKEAATGGPVVLDEETLATSQGVVSDREAKLTSFFHSKSLARKEARAEARSLRNTYAATASTSISSSSVEVHDSRNLVVLLQRNDTTVTMN